MSDKGDLYNWNQFVWYSERGAMTDHNGVAYLATRDAETKTRFLPSQAKRGKLPDPKYTHIMWYNL